MQLTVFRGGFTAAAAAAVVDLSAFTQAPSIADVLAELRDSSLLRIEEQAEADPNHGLRWGLYRAIQEYASDLSQQQDTHWSARRRHAEYYLGLGEQLVADLVGPSSMTARSTLALETPNLRQAFASMTSEGVAHDSARLSRCALVLHEALKMRLPSLAVELLTVALQKENDPSRESEPDAKTVRGSLHPRTSGGVPQRRPLRVRRKKTSHARKP